MSKLDVKKVIIHKTGISFFIDEGLMKGNGTFELEFKIDEMNDVLKSLFVLDTSENGYVSSISYDAALDTSQLLKSIMLNVLDHDSFSSLITQIKGADVVVQPGIGVDILKAAVVADLAATVHHDSVKGRNGKIGNPGTVIGNLADHVFIISIRLDCDVPVFFSFLRPDCLGCI